MHACRKLGQLLAFALLLFGGLAQAVSEPPAPYREETIPITLDDGRVLQARLRFPPGASAPLPAVMLFGGFRGAARVLDRVHAGEPLVFASFDYPFEPPRKFVFPKSLKHAPEMKAAIHGTLEGVGKLYLALRQRSDLDPKRITVAGASAGAPFATIAAAEHHIPGVVIVHGFGRITSVIARQFVRKWEPRYGRWSALPAWPLALFCIWYTGVPDPEDFAARMSGEQKVLMISAAQDSFIPREASDALWDAFDRSQAKHERVELPGDHVGRSDQQLAEILERALAWLRKNDLL